MAADIDARLKELGIELPQAAAPAANYVPYVISGNHVFVAGQISFWNGEILYKGRVGEDVSVEDAYKAARTCGLNLLAQVRAALDGDLSRVKQVVKLGGFVNSVPGFTEQPEVINGASDLMVDVFGDAGKHARAAVSAAALPRNVAVEVDGIFEVS